MLRLLLLFALGLPHTVEIEKARAKAQPLLGGELCPFCSHLSRDGKAIVVAGGTQMNGDWKIFDLATGECKVNGTDGRLRCGGAWGAALSDDKSLLAVGGNSNSLFLVRADSGRLYWDLTSEARHGHIQQVFFTPGRKFLISRGFFPFIRVWDLEKKELNAVFRFPSTNPRLNFWKNEAYEERTKRVFDMEGKYNELGQLALAPDGKTLALGGNLDGEIPLIDLETGKLVKTIKLKRKYGLCLQFSADGKWLAVGGGAGAVGESPLAGSVEIWDVEKNELVTSFGKHEGSTLLLDGSILHIAMSPDKKSVVTGGVGDGFRVWDVATGKQKFSYFTKEDPRLPRIKVFPDGSKLVEKDIRSAGVAFLPDGKTFLIVPEHWSTEIYFHDTATGEAVDFRKAVKPSSGCRPRKNSGAPDAQTRTL